jgi:hypothetical protein
MSERDNLIRPELQKYPRIPSLGQEDAANYVPAAYVSIQSRVNSEPEFESYYISKIISEGWVRLANIDSILMNSLKGKHFKYRLNGKGMSKAEAGTFRSGGMIIGMKEDDTRYVLYKSYNGCIFPIQLKDIKEIYIKDPNQETIRFTILKAPTRFPVTLMNKETGNEEIVFYAKSEHKREEFMVSKNYLKASKSNKWIFVDRTYIR